MAEAVRQATLVGICPIGAIACATRWGNRTGTLLYGDLFRRLLPGRKRAQDLFAAGAVAGLIGLWAVSCPAAHPEHHSLVADTEVFYGVIPSQILRGYPAEHAERKMHGGVPGDPYQYHLIVSLFDAGTKQRIVDAEVSARVSAVGSHAQQKTLEHMEFAGAVTYGNYFRMPPPGPYRIQLDIRRPGARRPVSTAFEYSHPVPGS